MRYRKILEREFQLPPDGEPRIVYWKNACGSIRWYRERDTGAIHQVRPDGEIIYWEERERHDTLCSVLIEDDRATMQRRDYLHKFGSYLDYSDTTGHKPPLILVITQNERAQRRIRESAATVSEQLPVPVVPEASLLEHGQFPWLTTSPASD